MPSKSDTQPESGQPAPESESEARESTEEVDEPEADAEADAEAEAEADADTRRGKPAVPPADADAGVKSPKRRRLIILLLLGAIVLAFFVPRLIAWRGIPMAVNLEFADQLFHLYHVDLLYKRHTLDEAYMGQPYFHQFPDMKNPRLPTRWPPGLYWVTFPFAKAFGVYSIWTTQLPNFIASVLIVLGVVLLGRIMGGTRLGLWAALLTVLCPALVASSWYYSLDYPLIAMILMGLYLLWRTRGFT